MNEDIKAICPRCKESYFKNIFFAISRKDNKTEICPDCGVKEAIEAFTNTEYTGEVYWEKK